MLEIFYFDKTVKKAKITELNKIKNKQLWIDCTNITKEEAKLLKTIFDLHPLTKEDILNSNTRIKTEEFNNYLLCVFYGIQKTKKIELTEIDFIIGKNFIISNHIKQLEAVEEIKKNNEKIENLFKKGNDFILHKLLDNEIDNYFPVLDKLDDQIEFIEDQAIKRPKPKLLSKVLELKRLIVRIKRTTLPQREKISFLTKGDCKFISKKSLPYFRDVYDHAIRVSDIIDNCRDSIGNAFDVYMSTISNSMNEVMKVLSVIATIALPLTVISGIYGTNFDVLPGQHFLFGFWIMIFAMILLSLGMIYFFKRRGWF